MFCEKGVLKNFTKFTGKHLYQSLFLIKLQASGLYLEMRYFDVVVEVIMTFHCLLKNLRNKIFYFLCTNFTPEMLSLRDMLKFFHLFSRRILWQISVALLLALE